MRRARRALAQGLAAAVILAGVAIAPARAEEAPSPPAPPVRQPFEMVRELRQMQDRIASGDTEAVVKQRALIDKMTVEFETIDDEVWKDPRNGRAILAFTLSGGDPKSLRTLLLKGLPTSVDVGLARGVHAFVTGRRGEAMDAFLKFDPLAVEPTIAGQVALAQSELLARSDVTKALLKLDEARLLAPGTLIEEAALRREVGLLSAQKNFDAADKLSEIYFRRFPNSTYATALKRQITRFATTRPTIDEHAPATLLVTALERLARRDRLEMYLEVAREAVARSRRDIVAFATARAIALMEKDNPYSGRAQIYVGSMQAASLEADQAWAALEDLKAKAENKEDLELVAAAQAISSEVRKVATVTPSDKPDPKWISELGLTFDKVGHAQALIADADTLLVEAAR